MNWKVDRGNLARDVGWTKLKNSNLGYAVGDTIKFVKQVRGSDDGCGRYTIEYGKGIIEGIYPYFFLVNLGKYRVAVSKVDVWLREGERVWHK